MAMSHLRYYELTEQIRQTDPVMRQLLNNVRIGQPTQRDLEVLQARKQATRIVKSNNYKDIARCLLERQKVDARTVALFPTRLEVAAINYSVLRLEHHEEVYKFEARDLKSPNAARLCQLQEIDFKVPTDERDTAGLEEQLILAKGCSALRSNHHC